MDLQDRYIVHPVEGRTMFWPTKAHYNDAGYDLYYNPADDEPTRLGATTIPSMWTVMLSTGIMLELPPGSMGLVLSRSGLAKNSVFVANAPGLIDEGYKGEVKVLLYNGGPDAWTVGRGERIAQLLVVPNNTLLSILSLNRGARGAGGFGSTGA